MNKKFPGTIYGGKNPELERQLKEIPPGPMVSAKHSGNLNEVIKKLVMDDDGKVKRTLKPRYQDFTESEKKQPHVPQVWTEISKLEKRIAKIEKIRTKG